MFGEIAKRSGSVGGYAIRTELKDFGRGFLV